MSPDVLLCDWSGWVIEEGGAEDQQCHFQMNGIPGEEAGDDVPEEGGGGEQRGKYDKTMTRVLDLECGQPHLPVSQDVVPHQRVSLFPITLIECLGKLDLQSDPMENKFTKKKKNFLPDQLARPARQQLHSC